MKTNESLIKENHNYRRENDQLSSELLKLKSKNTLLEKDLDLQKSVKSKEKKVFERLKSSESLLATLKEEILKNSFGYKENLSKLIYSKNQLIAENKEISHRLQETEVILNQKNNEISHLKQENSKLITEMACMEQHLCMQEDSNQIIDNLRLNIKSLRKENKEKTISIEDLNEKIKETTKTI